MSRGHVTVADRPPPRPADIRRKRAQSPAGGPGRRRPYRLIAWTSLQVVTVMLEVEPSTQNMGTCLMWQTREAQPERSTRVERISNSFTTHLLNIVWNGVGSGDRQGKLRAHFSASLSSAVRSAVCMISPANGAGGPEGAGFGAVRARLVWSGNYRNGDKRSASTVTFDNLQGTASAVPHGPRHIAA